MQGPVGGTARPLALLGTLAIYFSAGMGSSREGIAG
jgi:hypothetical protein